MKGSRAIRPGRFALLLLAILLFLVTVAVSASRTQATLPLRTASSLLLVVALYAASGRRWILLCGAVLAGAAIASSWSSTFLVWSGLYESSLVATAIFLVLAAGSVLAAVLADRDVSLDTIAGAIGVYLLLGICFAYVHLIVLAADPGAYRLAGGPLGLPKGLAGLQTSLYYSFTTLTTLGYGDLHPIHPLAQLASNAEAVGGQLFIAVLIARLVSAYRGRGGGPLEPEEKP